MNMLFTPGTVVRLPARPDWGIGRVQSAVGPKVTVDFDHGGKVVLDTREAKLELVRPPRDPLGDDMF